MILNISSDRVDFDETFYVLEQTTIVKNIKTVQTRYDWNVVDELELIASLLHFVPQVVDVLVLYEWWKGIMNRKEKQRPTLYRFDLYRRMKCIDWNAC